MENKKFIGTLVGLKVGEKWKNANAVIEDDGIKVTVDVANIKVRINKTELEALLKR